MARKPEPPAGGYRAGDKSIKGRRSGLGEQRDFDTDTPAVRDALLKARNYAYSPEAEIPIAIETPTVDDDELLRLAREIVEDRDLAQKSPALHFTKHLMDGEQSRYETLHDAIFDVAKNPAQYIYGFDKTRGRARKNFQSFAGWLRSANRFVLDDGFVTRAAELSWQDPVTLLSLADIARPPAERCWIEWDEQVRLRAAGLDRKSLIAEGIDPRQIESNVAHGFAIQQTESGTMIVEGIGLNPDYGLMMNTFGLAFEPSGTVEPALHRECDLQLDRLIEHHMRVERERHEQPGILFFGQTHALGTTWMSRWKQIYRETEESKQAYAHALASLAVRYRYIFSRAYGWIPSTEQRALASYQDRERLETGLREIEGDIRLLISILAMMQSSFTVSDRTWRQERNTGTAPVKHQRPYLESTKVRLRLPRERPLKVLIDDLGKGVIAHKRRHQRLAHWRERSATKANGCQHVMEAVTQSRLRCRLCGHLKWHVRQHECGDAALGYVHHPDYLVESSRKQTKGEPR